MSLAPGTSVGPYQILAPLGAGGMGEVYRARDTRLEREVAVKVLPVALATDPVALARFEREARAVAALSHPNILAIHEAGRITDDHGSGQPLAYAVAELLEGRSLREALEEGPLPPRKAIDLALQIAHGLAAAHDKGIVHRDIKPDNLFVTHDGRVKILDFGLAQMVEAPFSDSQHTTLVAPLASAIGTSPGTAPGMVVGTVGYMAPEQVRGLAVDARTDIFAFGAVLYEMLSGRRAFTGETPADTVSAILRGDPPELGAGEPGIPPALDRIVRRCLEKQPAERFQSARDLAFALDSVTGSGSSSGSSPRVAGAAPRARGTWALVAALVAGVLAGAAGMRYAAAPAPETRIVARFTVPSPLGLPPWVAISPNGQNIVWSAVSTSDNGNRIWLRRLAETGAREIPNQRREAASGAMWLADSRRLLLVRGPALYLLDTETGSQDLLREAPPEERRGGLRGLALGPSDQLLIGTGNGIMRGPVAPDAQYTWVRQPIVGEQEWLGYPQWWPVGNRYLYMAARSGRESTYDAFVAPFDGGEPVRLELPTGITRVLVDAEGYIIFGLNGTLQAQRIDLESLQLLGESVQLSTDMLLEQRTGFLAADISPAGVLVYRTLGFARVQFEWVDRNGRLISNTGPVEAFTNFDLSPDGQRIAVTRREVQTTGNSLWLIDEARGLTTQLADPSQGSISDPTWSPDGERLAFRRGPAVIVRNAFGGADMPVTDWTGYPDSWSRDGRYLTVGRPIGGEYELWAVRTDGQKEEIPIVRGAVLADEAKFSPDGKWVAYHETVERTAQVYVVPFPPTGERFQISTRGGVQPRWRNDGQELFYLDPQGQVVSVELPGGDPRQATPGQVLFRTTIEPSSANDQYAVAPGGQRFVVRRPVGETMSDQAPLTVVVNWRDLVPR